MFDEMPPEHFYQFLASSRPPPPPTPTPTQLPPHSLCFSSTTANLFPQFDHHHNYPSSHLHLQSPFMLHDHKNEDHQHHHKEVDHDHHQTQLFSSVLELDRDPRPIGVQDQWTNEEVFELIRIRSNMENWFPADLTWNHVSRKLAELGFKKSPQNCKEKFEEESQHFTNNVITSAKNYTFFSELEEICHGDQNPPVTEEEDDDNPPDEENAQQGEDLNQMKREKRKRSRKKEFEKLKEFCEEIVNRMMAQQEELNNKLIHDMLKRDEENLAKEEVRKKEETERINKEIESRAQEHAIAKERQAKIIEFLNKFASNSRNLTYHHNKLESASSSSMGPNYDNARENPNGGYTLSEKDDTGKRWPRDEVMALINLRSNHYRDEKEGLSRGPLWERISKGMLELGYKRSSKRCKEKWENINKYYKKTKDANKKRSLDSRTCPYFHQLTTLYNQTTFGQPENHLLLTENHNVLHGDDHDDDDNHEGEKNLVL